MGFAFGSTAMPTMPVVAFMPRARRGAARAARNISDVKFEAPSWWSFANNAGCVRLRLIRSSVAQHAIGKQDEEGNVKFNRRTHANWVLTPSLLCQIAQCEVASYVKTSVVLKELDVCVCATDALLQIGGHAATPALTQSAGGNL